MIIHVHALQPSRSRKWPSKKPVRPLARYCTPSRMPATVAAPLVPPKSIEAVPVSIPCTPKIHTQVKPIIKAASAGAEAQPSTRSEAICPR